MAYSDESVVQTWLDALKGLNVHMKRMFGCYCIYCDNQPVGWLSDNIFSLRDVDLPYLPSEIKQSSAGNKYREIIIPPDYRHSEWLLKAVQDTANIRKAQKQ